MAHFISVEKYLARPYTDYEWGEIFYAPEPPTEYIPLCIPEVCYEEIPEVAAWMELEDQL